jgi:hypothetical protein
MKPDKQHLLHELLDDGCHARREAILLAGARILRRRRQWRATMQGLSVALVLLAAGLWRETARSPRPANPIPLQAKIAPAPAEPQTLTDDQLLALFPKTPIGLATLADGKKRLIFPCPGDEQKYVIHL